MGFAIQRIGSTKEVFWRALPLLVTKLKLLHTTVVSHYTHWIGQRREGCQNAQKRFIKKAH